MYRNLSGEIQLWKSTEIRRHTAGAEAVVFRLFPERLLWMNTEEQNNTHRSYFLKNLFENPNVSVLKWNSHYNSSIICLYPRLKLDQSYKTKLSRTIWIKIFDLHYCQHSCGQLLKFLRIIFLFFIIIVLFSDSDIIKIKI